MVKGCLKMQISVRDTRWQEVGHYTTCTCAVGRVGDRQGLVGFEAVLLRGGWGLEPMPTDLRGRSCCCPHQLPSFL